MQRVGSRKPWWVLGASLSGLLLAVAMGGPSEGQVVFAISPGINSKFVVWARSSTAHSPNAICRIWSSASSIAVLSGGWRTCVATQYWAPECSGGSVRP